MLRGQSGLLTQFASRRDRRIFAREVEQSSRQLPKPARQRMAILVDHRHTTSVVDRRHRDRSEKLDDVPARDFPARHNHVVGAQGQNPAAVNGVGTDRLEVIQPRAVCSEKCSAPGGMASARCSLPSRWSMPFEYRSGISTGSCSPPCSPSRPRRKATNSGCG